MHINSRRYRFAIVLMSKKYQNSRIFSVICSLNLSFLIIFNNGRIAINVYTYKYNLSCMQLSLNTWNMQKTIEYSQFPSDRRKCFDLVSIIIYSRWRENYSRNWKVGNAKYERELDISLVESVFRKVRNTIS